MTYRERREARAARLREWAEKREDRAAAVFRDGERFHGDVAFNTQPGHIPERARLIAREDRALASLDKARGMTSRAETIERQADEAIYCDDENASATLLARAKERDDEAEERKRFNAAWRKGGAGACRTAGFDEKLIANAEATMRLCPWLKQPLDTTGLRAGARRDRERAARLDREVREGPPWRYYTSAKYGGACVTCGGTVQKGEPILYRRPDIRHPACQASRLSS